MLNINADCRAHRQSTALRAEAGHHLQSTAFRAEAAEQHSTSDLVTGREGEAEATTEAEAGRSDRREGEVGGGGPDGPGIGREADA